MLARKIELPYGPIFHHTGAQAGRQSTDDAIRILENRLPQNRTLRKLPLTKSLRAELTQKCLSFLKEHNDHGPFELDNHNHVGRLLGNMKRYGGDLKAFLDIEFEDLQCLAALHDLGKSRIPQPMYKVFEKIFGKEDFIALRVLPHELYSMFWIQQIGTELKLPEELTQTLMDQIANHNFGPDLTEPSNQLLFQSRAEDRGKHWWIDHWRDWAARAADGGLPVNAVYGHPESPLANSLVIFDRIDGGHPYSWEKFLNQDLVSGKLLFTPKNIINIIAESNFSARDQIRIVGRQLRTQFLGARKSASIEDFPPYVEAIRMLSLNDSVVNRLQESNEPEIRKQFAIKLETSILYQDRNQLWSRFDSISSSKKGKTTTSQGIHFEWNGEKWIEKQTGSNPVGFLLETVYRDWNLNL